MRLDVDGVGVLLTQGLVLLGVEGLALQVNMAHRTDEAGVVPGVTQRLDELVPSLHREVTTVALGAEQRNVIFLAVGLSILHMEEAVSKGLATGSTHKAGRVPCLSQCMHHLPHDLGVAAGTGGGEEFAVAVLTVNVVLFLHKADVCQRRVTVGTVELLRVPGAPQSHQEGTPDDVVASSTEGSTAAGGEPLRPLSHAPGHRG